MSASSSVATRGDSGKRCPRKPAAASRACGSPRPSALAQQRAAAVLEVLAGVCTPPEAAAFLNISVNGYYLLERKALAGLTAACEPKPKGRRVPGAERRLVTLEREVQRLRRECLRQSALVRATQRAVGLPTAAVKPAAKEATTGGKRKRRRRATVRALRAAESLRKTALGPHAAAGVEQCSAETVPADPAAKRPDPAGDRPVPGSTAKEC